MPPVPPVEELLDRFETLMQHVADLHAPEFLGVDLTMPQAKVLYVVSVRPAIPMSALAAELRIGLSAISGLVDRLVAAGYVERREDPADRRQQLVSATPAGRAALDRMRELRGELMRRLLAGLDDAELAAMRTTIDALDREIQRLDRSTLLPNGADERTSA